MEQLGVASAEASARLLAAMVASGGQIIARDLRILDEHLAFDRLGVSRARFLELAEASLANLRSGLSEHCWLDASTRAHIDGLLEAVVDPQHRMLICQLAAAVVMANGNPAYDAHPVYHHVLAQWHIADPAMDEGLRRSGASGLAELELA